MPTQELFNKQDPIPRIAVIVETTRAYGRRIVEGVGLYARENQPWMLMVEPRSLTDPLPDWFDQWQGDGIIARVTSQQVARQLLAKRLPLVNLKVSETQVSLPQPQVQVDQVAIGQLAAQHFLDRGFRQFGFVGGAGLAWSDGRLAGFQKEVEMAGYSCSPYPNSMVSVKKGTEGHIGLSVSELTCWLNTLPKPVGILAADDFLALQLLNACHSAGIHVPDQAAIAGVDDEELICTHSYPRLTSVVPDNVRLGKEAAALLDRLMRGETVPDQPCLIPPKEIVTRQSSDIVAIEDPVMAEAIRYIRTNACKQIGIDDVCRHVKTSSSTLQRRFRHLIGYSIYDYILYQRLAQVRTLLSDTELPLKTIAFRSGFRHFEHLSALFKKKTGYTLNEFRMGKLR